MASRKPLPDQPLSREARRFWREAFGNAELPALLRRGMKRIDPEGLAHLSAEYADAAVNEYRRRFPRS